MFLELLRSGRCYLCVSVCVCVCVSVCQCVSHLNNNDEQFIVFKLTLPLSDMI